MNNNPAVKISKTIFDYLTNSLQAKNGQINKGDIKNAVDEAVILYIQQCLHPEQTFDDILVSKILQRTDVKVFVSRIIREMTSDEQQTKIVSVEHETH